MTDCQHCTAPCQLYLCGRCTAELRALLRSLVTTTSRGGKRTLGWLEYLTDAAVSQTAMGQPARHIRTEPVHLDGDATLASHIEAYPDDETTDIDQARRDRQSAALRHALAAGKVNARASDLLADARVIIGDWTGHINARRDLRWQPDHVPTTAEMAAWLASHADAIACDEMAGQLHAQIDRLVRRIKNVINRAIPPRFCGPCTNVVYRKADDGVIRKVTCGTLLDAQPRATEVTCPSCNTAHDVEHLIETLARRTDHMRFTSADVLLIMTALGTPIPERSWRRWRKEGRVKIRGYQRPDRADGNRGAIGLTRRTDDDEPVYRLAEVRKTYARSIRHTDAQTSMDGEP